VAGDRAQVRREEILESAVSQLIQRGLASIRVNDVAKSLGISTGLIFYHFGSKEQLIADAFAFAADQDLEHLQVISDSGAPVIERLSRAVALYGPSGDARGWRIWLDGWSGSLRNDRLRATILRFNEAWFAAFVALIAEGVEAGTFRSPDPKASANRIIAMLDGCAVQSVLWGDLPRTDDMYRTVHAAIADEIGVSQLH
jgi:AcrR family transcriptional regulator